MVGEGAETEGNGENLAAHASIALSEGSVQATNVIVHTASTTPDHYKEREPDIPKLDEKDAKEYRTDKEKVTIWIQGYLNSMRQALTKPKSSSVEPRNEALGGARSCRVRSAGVGWREDIGFGVPTRVRVVARAELATGRAAPAGCLRLHGPRLRDRRREERHHQAAQ